MYTVKEIFKSIQGEGYNIGKESVFVRFTGCNLWNGKKESKNKAICNFCDTDFVGTDGNNGGIYSLESLVDKIEQVWNSSFSLEHRYVILTGGEPLLQVDANLVDYLKCKKYKVALETNGTIQLRADFDWVCVSPKDPENWLLKKGDELKVIYPQNKFNLQSLLTLDFKYFFLQPKYDKLKQLNFNKTIDYCKIHRQWFPSIQIHKTIGVQ